MRKVNKDLNGDIAPIVDLSDPTAKSAQGTLGKARAEIET